MWWDVFMPAKSPLSITNSGTMIETNSSRPWINARIVSGWTLKSWHHSYTCPMWPGALKKPLATILRALAYIPNGLGPGVTTIGR